MGKKCEVCLHRIASSLVSVKASLNEIDGEVVAGVFNCLLLPTNPKLLTIGESGDLKLLMLCLECKSSLNQLTKLFMELEKLRLQFNTIRRNFGRQVISLHNEENNSGMLKEWEDKLGKSEDVFPSRVGFMDKTGTNNDFNELMTSSFQTASGSGATTATSNFQSSEILLQNLPEECWIKNEPSTELDFEMEEIEPFHGNYNNEDPLSNSNSNSNVSNRNLQEDCEVNFRDEIEVGEIEMAVVKEEHEGKDGEDGSEYFPSEEESQDISSDEEDETSSGAGARTTNFTFEIDLTNSESRIPCTHCDFSFPDSEVLKAHKLKAHILGSKQDGYSQCQYCLKFFMSKEELNEHETKKHFPSCTTTTKTTTKNKKQLAININCFLCKKCPKISTLEDLKNHERSQMHKINLSVVSVYCNVCRINFEGNVNALRTHLKTPGHLKELKSLNYFDLKLFCVPCRENFECTEDVAAHEKGEDHKKVTTFRKKVYRRYVFKLDAIAANNLKKTVTNKDAPAKKPKPVKPQKASDKSDPNLVLCPHCDEGFTKTHPVRLRRHLLHEHPDEYLKKKPHPCRICFHAFESERSLELHMKCHDHLKCSYCEKIFMNKEILGNHVRTHTGEKPFGCDICGRTFRTMSNRNRHMTIHGDDS